MDLSGLAKGLLNTATRNSTSLLTGAAVAGVLSTVIFAVRGTVEAVRAVDADPRDLSNKELVQTVWPYYIPALVTGTITVACIVGSHNVAARKNAIMVSAYSVSERAMQEYKTVVKEKLGEKKALEIQEEVAEKRIKSSSGDTVIVTGNGEQLCYEPFSGRYFESNIESIRQEVNNLNEGAINSDWGFALNEFYGRIGLDPTGVGDEFGWNADALMRVSFTGHVTAAGKACISMEYDVPPFLNYWKTR